MFVYIGLLCCLLAFGKAVYQQAGPDIFWGLLVLACIYGMYFVAPLAGMSLSEVLTEVPRRRAILVDALMAMLVLAALLPVLYALAEGARFSPLEICFGILVTLLFGGAVWSPILYVWWNWRADQLSPQLDVLERMRRADDAKALEFFQDRE